MNAPVTAAFRAAENRPASADAAMVNYLRAMVLDPTGRAEKFHALFVDADRNYLGDAPMGQGDVDSLTVRMRDVFGRALTLDARGILIAHNHPSGHCRPSQFDISATCRLKHIANALDIELLDHLIFTRKSAYSMRAGGLL